MILDRFKLTDRVAIVTGAGKGIGRGIAIAFAEAGADVVCAARTQADLDAVAEEIRRRGRRALAVPTDVMKTEELQRLVDAALEAFGRIDVLVNNAGVAPENLAKFQRPLYAAWVTGALAHTQGGLRVNAHAQVLRANGTAILVTQQSIGLPLRSRTHSRSRRPTVSAP